jgi:multicomponent Na+:H+ antiporter subunit G
MEDIAYLIATIAVLIGTAFSILGIIGLLRLPDVYTRMHATGKVATFGGVLLAVAAALVIPGTWGKAAILIVLLVLAGPVISHAVGSAAYRLGIPMKQAVRDDLAGKRIDRPPEPSSRPTGFLHE